MDNPIARLAALEHAVAFLLSEISTLRYPDKPADLALGYVLKDLQIQSGLFDHTLGEAIGELAHKARERN